MFLLDTGAWETSIDPKAASDVTKVMDDDKLHVQGLSGEVAHTFSADSVIFSFAKMEQRIAAVASFDTDKLSRGLGMEISGFLGARTLCLMTIHLDYRDGLVKFDYDPKYLNITIQGATAR